MFGASALLLLLLLLNSQLYASAPIPAEGPQSFTFVQEPFPDEHVSVEKTDSDEEEPIPDKNAAPCPNKPLTTACHFPEEPALVSSTGIFEANGGAAPEDSDLSERPVSAEPNHVASASTQEASEDREIQRYIKFDEPDLDLEKEEYKFPDVYLEINEGKPEEDLKADPGPSEPVIPEEDLTADLDALPIQTEANFVDSENEKVRHMELAEEEETLDKAVKISPISTGLEVDAEDQTPGHSLQTEEENQEFDAGPSAEVVYLFNVSKAASLQDPSPADAVIKVPMEDADEKEDSVAAKEDSDTESPSTAAEDPAASEADGIYVAVKSSRQDFKAPVSSVQGESQAQVNRGAIIGAALITLISFILIGFVGIKISKKLR